jgi:hypothetical protein
VASKLISQAYVIISTLGDTFFGGDSRAVSKELPKGIDAKKSDARTQDSVLSKAPNYISFSMPFVRIAKCTGTSFIKDSADIMGNSPL